MFTVAKIKHFFQRNKYFLRKFTFNAHFFLSTDIRHRVRSGESIKGPVPEPIEQDVQRIARKREKRLH